MDADFIHDLFAPFRPVTVRRMFSGAGLFCDGVMFGLVVRGVIYLKADETSVAAFEREGSEPFTYVRGKSTRGKSIRSKSSGHPSRHALPYWRLPERLYDDPDALAAWASQALAIAQRKKLAPRPRSPRKKRTRRKQPLRAGR